MQSTHYCDAEISTVGGTGANSKRINWVILDVMQRRYETTSKLAILLHDGVVIRCSVSVSVSGLISVAPGATRIQTPECIASQLSPGLAHSTLMYGSTWYSAGDTCTTEKCRYYSFIPTVGLFLGHEALVCVNDVCMSAATLPVNPYLIEPSLFFSLCLCQVVSMCCIKSAWTIMKNK